MSNREEEIRAHTIGALEPLNNRIVLVDYDPRWPDLFQGEADRIRKALGHRALQIEHVGSTSVPGLIAKPIIDMLLMVSDSADERAYAAGIEANGYVLRSESQNSTSIGCLEGRTQGSTCTYCRLAVSKSSAC